MLKEQRDAIRASSTEVGSWVARAQRILTAREEIGDAGREALARLGKVHKAVLSDGSPVWLILVLDANHRSALADLRRMHVLPRLTPRDYDVLDTMAGRVAKALTDVRSIMGLRGIFSGSAARDRALQAADYLQRYHAWGRHTGVMALLQRLEEDVAPQDRELALDRALDSDVGLVPRLVAEGQLHDASAYGVLKHHRGTLRAAAQQEARYRKEALERGQEVRQLETRKLLSEMPVDRIREATGGRLSLGALGPLGIKTVQQLLDAGHGVQAAQGIGATTAARMVGAAQSIWHTTLEETPFRIDIKRRTPQTTQFLRSLAAWDAIRRFNGGTMTGPVRAAFEALEWVFDQRGKYFVLTPAEQPLAEFDEAAKSLEQQARHLADATSARAVGDPWRDFLARPADYYALIAELGFNVEDEEKTYAGLPAEIVEAARRVELDTTHLAVNLRGYQAFAARFSIAQQKVIIGDEMGLGKTIEALAVLAHLRGKGHHHFLVVCPAAVVSNWTREIVSKSKLSAHRLHGYERIGGLASWRRRGGVAVTTFETLKWLESEFDREAPPEVGCMVVDEAHYIKNPDARRTRRTANLLEQSDRAILMTGTPLENRTEEFRNLVHYIRPDLTVDATDFSPSRFRKQVAPAYLRRNTEDVLKELPDLVEVREWVPMTRPDAQRYRQAVIEGNFMAMRQAAMLSGADSAKVQRIVDLVREAEENGRRVLVFSFFRDVLTQVARNLPGDVYGPLTGSVPPARRQEMVDSFSKAGHGAVLVSQIQAGGVGLNIQAASMVIICEPQLKPTMEWQAIARARRMGQTESVQVHRLISEEGVDQRVVELLEVKEQLFAEFARESDVAQVAPEAYDVSEAELARQVVAEERERLLGGHPHPPK